MSIVTRLLDGNEREVAKLKKIAQKVNVFEPELEALSDDQLKSKTKEFKGRLANGETLDDLLPEAFAVVREAAKRTIGQRHFDVQMMGGIVLHQGRIAEMRTGEGKTLTATLPLYLNSLEGKGAHLVTVNDYLGKFHAQWMGKIYHFLGVSVGALQGSSAETGEMEASYIFDPDHENEDEPVYRNLRRVDKREAYDADITYGTNHVFGFDYLRDNMSFSKKELVQPEQLHYAIVDEVDSILIDEARTPLIISGIKEESTGLYIKMDQAIGRLVFDSSRINHKNSRAPKEEYDESEFYVDFYEKERTATLTDEGDIRIHQAFGITPEEREHAKDDPELEGKLYQGSGFKSRTDFEHHASAALKARVVFKKDIDYVVKDGQIIIVDEFTGRLMFGRRYGDGLHQAIEAKEGVKIEHESQTLATITYQNYFRLYKKLSGMTGTAKTEEGEFCNIYGLDVIVVPTNRPMIRADHQDIIYKTEEAKLRGISAEILRLHARLQPVLVGTRSIEMSERVSDRISAEKLQLLTATLVLREKLEKSKDLDANKRKEYLNLLNVKFSELTLAKLVPVAREVGVPVDMLLPENVNQLASIIEVGSQEEIDRLGECLSRGIPHSILNAKNHEKEAQIIADAGRLGVVTIATNMAGRGVDIILGGKPDDDSSDSKNPQAADVVDAGGLYIVGTERHESRRIDNQLRGRSGRQGDPGGSRFFVSLEDELWRVFGDKSNSPWLSSWQEDMAMDSKILSRMIERTQKKMEEHYFAMRKNVLKYDDVMNVQRELIYSQRRKIIEGVDLRPTIIDFLHTTVSQCAATYCPPEVHPSEWDTRAVYDMLNDVFPLSLHAKPEDLKDKKHHELEEFLCDIADKTYQEREEQLGAELMRDLERHIALRAINSKWVGHLDAMDYLREGIGLRGYAQQDPVVAYKQEAYDMFTEMMNSIQDEIVRLAYRVQVQVTQEPFRNPYRNVQMTSNMYTPGAEYAETGEDGERLPVGVAPNRGTATATVKHKGKVGRNDPCPCGSGKKYKKCCLVNEE